MMKVCDDKKEHDEKFMLNDHVSIS